MENQHTHLKNVNTSDLKEEFGSYFRVVHDSASTIVKYMVVEVLGQSYEKYHLMDAFIGLSGQAAEDFRSQRQTEFQELVEAIKQAKKMTKSMREEQLEIFNRDKNLIYPVYDSFLRLRLNLTKNEDNRNRLQKIRDLSTSLEKTRQDLEHFKTEDAQIAVHYLPKTFKISSHYPELGQKIYCVNVGDFLNKPFEETVVEKRSISFIQNKNEPTISISLKPGHYQYEWQHEALKKFDGTPFEKNEKTVLFTDKSEALSYLKELHQKIENNMKAVFEEKPRTPKM